MGEYEKRQPEPLVSFGPYRLDVGNVQLWRGGQEVRLTGKAFAVLWYLVEHAGQLATKDDLFAAAWPETVVSEATLVSGIQELRHALRDDAKNPRYIETVHRRGYRFIAEVQSPESQVQSQEDEAKQKAKGKNQKLKVGNSLESSLQSPTANGEEFDSVLPAQADRTEPQALASGEPSWIPASAGMTPLPSSLQPHNPSPQPDQVLDVSTLPARRSWSVRSLMVMGLVLLVGTILTVQYLSLPISSTQPLTPSTQSLPLPDKPSLVVLPFVNMSNNPDQEYFSDGLTEDLTSSPYAEPASAGERVCKVAKAERSALT